MMRYSIRPRDKISVNSDRFLSFAKNMGKNSGKNISKTLCGKYSQNLLDHFEQSTRDALKTSSKIVIQKAAEATGDLFDNKITNKITGILKYS